MSLSFFADGTTFVEPIECDKCGAKAYVIRRAPHPHIPHAEVQIFECPHCGHQMKVSAMS
jgi:Zn ribbon nucleic-acid-binding protein